MYISSASCKKIRILFLLTAIFLVGCDGNSSDGQGPLDTSANFSIGETSPSLIDAPLPAVSADPDRPFAFSLPDKVEVNPDSTAQIELAYKVSSAISSLYIGQNSANEHFFFDIAPSDSTDSSQNAIAFSVALPNKGQTICYDIAVGDLNNLISDSETICFEALNFSKSSRKIYLSNFSNLSTVSLDTKMAEPIGSTGVRLTDIAFLGAFFYGITATNLYRIDPETGQSTLIGSHGSSNANALEGHDGILYSADITGTIFTIDPDSATQTVIGNYPANAASSGDLVVSPNQPNLLYGTVRNLSPSSDTLITVNRITGETSIIGDTGYDDIWGLAFFRNQLFGLTNIGQLLLIDPTDGSSALVSVNNDLRSTGASVDIFGTFD